jgi:D-glycero-D-manno-heptose 1,7-bisphosphate phosphatase
MVEINMVGEPQQAVILCGGRGIRLKTLTDTLPKPMAPVNNRPFLEYLLRQLDAQGIKKFLLLTGYLTDCIENYFGDGSRWGWSVIYSRGPVEWDTGRRIFEARNLIEGRFLLLYSDNFIQFNLSRLLKLHLDSKRSISLTLVSKTNGNIKIFDGKVLAYDRARSNNGFDYVELGYMLVERDEVIEDLRKLSGFPDVNFSALLEFYGRNERLSALVMRDSYYSISDPKRLEITREYLTPKKIILMDRDGTINVKADEGKYIENWATFRWIVDTRIAMKKLAQQGFEFIVITNQAGIARGIVGEAEVANIHKHMVEELANDGIKIRCVYVSPHHWSENSFERKPSPGMFIRASQEHKFRLDHCFYVGDDDRDCIAAANAGCAMAHLAKASSLLEIQEMPAIYLKAERFTDLVDNILSKYQIWDN